MLQFPANDAIARLLLADPAHPDLIHIKVGRSKDVRTRLRQHRARCPSFNYKLIGSYPSTISGTNSAPVPYCDLLERLVHIELTDLSSKSYPAGRNAPASQCRDCQLFLAIEPPIYIHIRLGFKRHTEIFTFVRLKGNSRGREWSRIILPVIARWAQFVRLL